MQAMVLAAGFGSRLMPLTAEVSKVTFPLAGRPVIVRALDFLAQKASVDRFVVNLHHAPDSVKGCLKNYPNNIDYSFESDILGTGGALFKRKEDFTRAGETFIMANGDSYFGECPIDRALDFHRKKDALATLVVMDMPSGDSYGAVEVDQDFRVRKIAGKPAHVQSAELKPCHFVGIHILEPEILSRIPSGVSDINRDLYPPLIESGAPVYAFHTSFTWFDLGTPARFLGAFEILAARETIDSLLISDRSSVRDGGRLLAPIEICPGAIIEENSRIRRSIVMTGAVIGEDCRIENSIIGPEAIVGPGSRFSGVIAANVEGKLEISRWHDYRS